MTLTALPNPALTALRLRSLPEVQPYPGADHWLAGEDDLGSGISAQSVLLGGPKTAAELFQHDLKHVAADGQAWARTLVNHMSSEVSRTSPGAELRLAAPHAAAETRVRVESVLRLLRERWPEQALEMVLLQRACVYVESVGFVSASSVGYFGIVVLSVDACKDFAGTLEHLLHESGHSALYLGGMFEQYLYNPDDLAVHPLREDPRPLYGVLHAAMATVRVVAGLDRFRDEWVSVPDLTSRYAYNLDAATQIIETLSYSASWTPDGSLLFDSLRATITECARRDLL